MLKFANQDYEQEGIPPEVPSFPNDDGKQTCAEVLRSSWPPKEFRSAPESTLLPSWFLAQRESTAYASGIKFVSVFVFSRDTIARPIY